MLFAAYFLSDDALAEPRSMGTLANTALFAAFVYQALSFRALRETVSPRGAWAALLMVVVFGGVGNLWGTLVAGFSLGIANKFLEPYSGLYWQVSAHRPQSRYRTPLRTARLSAVRYAQAAACVEALS